MDFTADFSGSENLILDGSSGLISQTSINPMSTETVAMLKLRKNWKLKSRFKFTMRNPTKEIQRKHLMPHMLALDKLMERSFNALAVFPYDVSSKEALE